MFAIQPIAAHVLIVDDEPVLRDLFTDILIDEGYPVVAAAHGQEALEYLGRTSTLPCLILLDLNMPIMSGWEFRRAQIDDLRLAAIPVVALSAGATVVAQAKTISAAGYLAKPVAYEDLIATVAHYCRH